MQLVQLQNDLQVLRRAGLRVAAISYDSQGVLSDFAKRKSITFPLLSDHESEQIRAYGVVDRQYRKGMQLDVDTERVYNNSLGYVPVFGLSDPAVFVLTRDHLVKWRFVSEGPELRLTGAAILEESVSGVADELRTPVISSHVQVTATASNSSIGLGNRIHIGVELKMPKGFHVYSPDVGHDYKGVSWQIDPTDCLGIGEASYPKAELKLMKSTNETLPVYEDTLRITREIIVKAAIQATDPSIFKLFCARCLDAASHMKLSGVLTFQACDETRCYPPQTVHPQWTFRFIYPDRQRSPGELWRELEQ
jgi:hypothetical protein